MASKTAEILVVKVEKLSSYPQAFQEYVAKYFAPTKIFGIECMYAFRCSDGHVANCSGGRNVLGVAPSHSTRLRAKVTDEMDLYTWMQMELKNKTQSDFVELFKQWDDGTISFTEAD